MFNKPIGPSPDWPTVFKDWEKSGLNQRDFCADQGYSYSRFKNARAKHGYTRSSRNRKKPAPVSASKVSNPQGGGFLAVSIEKELPKKPKAPARSVEQGEIELKLPFGVVLTFRGVAQG
jgi:hypothetical protein